MLKEKDFTAKTETLSKKKMGKREYLNNSDTGDLMKKLDGFFESMINVPRIKFGKKQSIESLIEEESYLFARYLRNEASHWAPRSLILSKE